MQTRHRMERQKRKGGEEWLKNRKPNFEIKNLTDTNAELYIYSDVVGDEIEGWWYGSDVYPTAIKQFLDTVKGKSLDVYVNSNGGSVFAGLAIYNMLDRHIQDGNTVTVHVDGLAASIASVIAMIGCKSGGLYCPENSFLMVHRAWCGTQGNAEDLRQMADTLDKIDASILSIYQNSLKDGVSIETIQELVNAETWLTGKDAAQYFNITSTQSIEAVACASDIVHKNMPNNLIKNEEKDLPLEDVPKVDETPKIEIQMEEPDENENEIEDLLLELDIL